MHEAAKYETRCEALAALVDFARTLIEQARAAEAERARVAAEAAAAAAEAEAKEALCVVCMDAPKDHFIRPCMHVCTCEACTQQLQEQGAQSCPVCRGPIEGIERVFIQ